MSLGRIFHFCLLVIALSTPKVEASTWTYTFSSLHAGRAQEISSAEFHSVTASANATSALLSSQFDSCSSCLRLAFNPAATFDRGQRNGQLEDQGSVSSAVVPEPSTIVLLLGGLVCIFVGVRGKTKVG